MIWIQGYIACNNHYTYFANNAIIVIFRLKLIESDNERSSMADKMKQLETLKLAASSDSPSDAFMGTLII